MSCWRSGRDPGEAQRRADQAAAAAAQRLLALAHGRDYGYHDHELREELLESLGPAEGPEAAAVTRNGYGAEVLNTASLFIADLDFPPPEKFGWLKRLFGRPVPRPEAKTWAGLERWAWAHPDWGLRVYRTPAGLRVIAVHATFDPAVPETLEHLRGMGADPLYVRLCKGQRCFRARLTAKPFRLGLDRQPRGYPRRPEQEAPFRDWLAAYQACCRGFAACAFVRGYGPEPVHPALRGLLDLHDQRSGAFSGLPLA